VLRARQTQHKLDTMRLSLFTESPESVYYTLVDEWSNNQHKSSKLALSSRQARDVSKKTGYEAKSERNQ
jgi:hypothetical protein